MASQPQHFVFYHYDPSMAAAVVSIILFSLTTLCHAFQLLRTRTWYFIPVVVGGLCKLLLFSRQALKYR